MLTQTVSPEDRASFGNCTKPVRDARKLQGELAKRLGAHFHERHCDRLAENRKVA